MRRWVVLTGDLLTASVIENDVAYFARCIAEEKVVFSHDKKGLKGYLLGDLRDAFFGASDTTAGAASDGGGAAAARARARRLRHMVGLTSLTIHKAAD